MTKSLTIFERVNFDRMIDNLMLIINIFLILRIL